MKDECYEFIKNDIGKANIVGFGSYGQVKIARNTQNSQIVAIKLIHGKNAKQEIDVHHKLNHPNIIKLLNYYYEKQKNITYMVLEYADNGTLNEKIKFGLGQLSKELIRKYFKDICQAIKYLHNHNYMHRDIKPQNILITKDNSAKLCDFGFAAIFEARTTMCGTFQYMAPEMIKKKHYNYKIDIWALGILLFEMIQGIAPFRGQTGEEVIAEMKKPIRFSSRFDSLEIQLIKKILRVNAENRPSVQEILDHPYFRLLKQNEKTNLTRNTVEIQSKSPKRQPLFIKEKITSSKQQLTKFLKNSNEKLPNKLQNVLETKNNSQYGNGYLKTEPSANSSYTGSMLSQSFKTKTNDDSDLMNKTQDSKRFVSNNFGIQSPNGQKKTKSPVNTKSQAKSDIDCLDITLKTQKKQSINTSFFGNTYNSSVKTLNILNKSKVEEPPEIGRKTSILGKTEEKQLSSIQAGGKGSVQYFNKSFNYIKQASEATSETLLKVNGPSIVEQKQEQSALGYGNSPKKTVSTNSSVNVSFKYQKPNSVQFQSQNTSTNSYQQNFQARKNGIDQTGFSYNQIYNLQKSTTNIPIQGPNYLTKLKESFK